LFIPFSRSENEFTTVSDFDNSINSKFASSGIFVSSSKTTPFIYPDTNSVDFKYFKSNLLKTYNQNVGAYNAQYYDIGYLYALAIEQSFFSANIDDIETFRSMVESFIRGISRPDPKDFDVYPSQGWETMKLAAIKGSIDYSGASGNCNIDQDGNVMTSFKVFTLSESGSELYFETIEFVNPVKK